MNSSGPRVLHLAGYEILGELGRGGMGVVYKARHRKLRHEVALKMILAGGHASDQELARFHLEAAAVARLSHPGIVHIHELGEHEGKPFFSLEYVGGGSLARRLEPGPLPARTAAELVARLARAMQHAHEHGILHRDLKPANVLLTAEGDPKITDFGLAKQMDIDDGLSRTGTVLGTPAYMAPEQAEGRVHAVGPTTDVYALGVILYECLTGRVPFKGTTLRETLDQVSSREAPAPRSLMRSLPRDLETVCLRCLEKDPKKRYATAAALADDLDRFQRGEPVAARPVGALERGWRWCRRNPTTAGLLTAVALALLAGASVSTWFGIEAAGKAAEADRQRAAAVHSAALARDKAEEADRERRTADGLAVERGQALVSLGQEKEAVLKQKAEALRQLEVAQFVAYAFRLREAQGKIERGRVDEARQVLLSCDPHLGGWEHEYLLQQTLRLQMSLTGHTAAIQAVACSPDGLLASASADRTVKIWDARTGRVVRNLTGSTGDVYSLCFSPDGARLASASIRKGNKPGETRVWDVANGKELLRLDDQYKRVAFSPDGTDLACLDAEHTIRMLDAGTGQERLRFAGHAKAAGAIGFTPDGKSLVAAAEDRTVMVLDARTGQEILTLKGHTEVPRCLACSPDGKHLASGCGGFQTSELKIWDLRVGDEVASFQGHSGSVYSMSYSPDGARLASSAFDGTLRVWDTRTGRDVLTLECPVGPVAFGPDGGRVALGSLNDPTLRVWDVRVGQEPRTFTTAGFRGWIDGVAFSPDGTRLASAAHDSLVKVWDVRTGKEALRISGHEGVLSAVCFSPDGTRLASAGVDRTVRIWDADKGRALLTFRGHTGWIRSVCFSPDGTRLASACSDHLLKVWDGATGRELLACTGHTERINCVCFRGDGRRLASAGLDRTIRVWDAGTGQELLRLEGHTDEVKSVSYSADGGRLVSASEDRTIRVWDADTGRPLLTVEGHAAGVASARFTLDGKRLVSGGRDRTVRVWDARTGQEALSLGSHLDEVAAVALSPDGTCVASASHDCTLKLWTLRRGAEAATLKGHTGSIVSVQCSPDGARVVSAGSDGAVKVWDARSGQELLSLRGPTGKVWAVAFSPDGERILSGHDDGGVIVWHAQKGQELFSLPRVHTGAVTRVAYSPDGRHILTGGAEDGTVRLWDSQTGQEVPTPQGNARLIGVSFSPDGQHLAGPAYDRKTNVHLVKVCDTRTGQETASFATTHTNRIGSVCWSPDGAQLASASWDQTVQVADARTGRAAFLLRQTGVVTGVAFSPDGRLLASASSDGGVRLWDAATGHQVLCLRGHADGVLSVAFSPDGRWLVSGSADRTVKVWKIPDNR